MAHVPVSTGAPPSPLTARVNSGAGFWASSVAVALRTIRKFVRTPQLLASFAFEWLFITIGLVAGNAQAAQGIAVLVVPLVFVSSAYVPVSTMPGWLQPIAQHQPLTPMVNAVRGLAGGPQAEALLHHTTAYYVGLSLTWSAAVVVVFGIVAAVRFSRR
jgi:ABC-2 type transport system permease protein